MLTAEPRTLEARAKAIAQMLRARGVECDLASSESSVGGGAFPSATLPSFAVALRGNAAMIEPRLRSASMPVVGRVKDGRVLLDMRSLLPGEDDALATSVVEALV
jgi:L-seryl-tRNA(Ser) seleniumtransferase